MADEKSQYEKYLLEGCAKDDAGCQKELFENYFGLLYGICLRYATDADEAKDILQDGFVKIFKSIKKFDQKGSLEGWMKKIMINNSIDHYRKKSSKPFTDDISEAYTLGEDETVNAELHKEELLALLQELPTGYRMVFNLYVIEGYSHKEIALELNISEGTSKSQLAKARKALQEKVKILYSDKKEI